MIYKIIIVKPEEGNLQYKKMICGADLGAAKLAGEKTLQYTKELRVYRAADRCTAFRHPTGDIVHF